MDKFCGAQMLDHRHAAGVMHRCTLYAAIDRAFVPHVGGLAPDATEWASGSMAGLHLHHRAFMAPQLDAAVHRLARAISGRGQE